MWFTLLGPLFTSIFGTNGVIGQYIAAKQAKEKAAADLELQITSDKFELSKEMARDDIEAKQAEIGMTSGYVKAIIILCVNIPILINCIFPVWGKAIFDSLMSVPQWYAMLDVAIIGTVFGLPIAANWMGTVFDNIQNAWANRQDKKIDVINATGDMHQASREAGKKELFDTIEKVTGLRGYTQDQVDAIDKTVDKNFPDNNQAS